MREKILTVVGLVVGIGSPLIAGISAMAATGAPWLLLLPILIALIFLVSARLAPRAYRLGADGVHVERRGTANVVVPYRDIRGVDRVRRSLVGLGAGSNGFLGRFTFGRGWRPGLGAYRILITNSFDVVWLQTTRGWVALSPERPEEFVARLRTRI